MEILSTTKTAPPIIDQMIFLLNPRDLSLLIWPPFSKIENITVSLSYRISSKCNCYLQEHCIFTAYCTVFLSIPLYITQVYIAQVWYLYIALSEFRPALEGAGPPRIFCGLGAKFLVHPKLKGTRLSFRSCFCPPPPFNLGAGELPLCLPPLRTPLRIIHSDLIKYIYVIVKK